MNTVPMPETMTLSQFAAHAGFKRSYATQLKNEGRLVMSPDGRRVLVADSLARIKATRDPSKSGVAQRHADAREKTPPPLLPPLPPHSVEKYEYDYQSSKAKREHWAAAREQTAYRKEAGELMERSDVVGAFADLGATVRSNLEAWASTLAPQLAGRDEPVMQATIADQVERLLNDMVDKINRMVGVKN